MHRISKNGNISKITGRILLRLRTLTHILATYYHLLKLRKKVRFKINNWRKNKRKTRRRKIKKKKINLRITTMKTIVIPITWKGTTNPMAMMMVIATAAVMRIIRMREGKNAHKNQNKMKMLIMKL